MPEDLPIGGRCQLHRPAPDRDGPVDGRGTASLVAVGDAAAAPTSVDAAARCCPGSQIDPLDYATRAHEILEDAQRDLLSGTDVPWSGAGVLGTAAGVAATDEVIRTLMPLLRVATTRSSRCETGWCGCSTCSTRCGAEHGTWPTLDQLTTASTSSSTARWPARSARSAGARHARDRPRSRRSPRSRGLRMKPVDRRRFLTRSLAPLGAGGVGVPRIGAGRSARRREPARDAGPEPQAGQVNRRSLRPRSVRRPRTRQGSSPRARSGDVHRARQHRAQRGGAVRGAASHSPTEARPLTQGDAVGVQRDRRSAAGLGDPRAVRQPRLADGHDRASGRRCSTTATGWRRAARGT